jgi:hypothetical protein
VKRDGCGPVLVPKVVLPVVGAADILGFMDEGVNLGGVAEAATVAEFGGEGVFHSRLIID